MPLAFSSQSHGTVAFGFFNIETDLLLLDRVFFFADAFCGAVVALARGAAEAELPAWRIPRPEDIGDLHGAIAGAALHGLIGATYRRWPFPRQPEAFKQNPEGVRRQDEVRLMLAPHGPPAALPVRRRRVTEAAPAAAGDVFGPDTTVEIGEYRFDGPGFAALVSYVERGGYPRWRDEQRPPYVERMCAALAREGPKIPSDK